VGSRGKTWGGMTQIPISKRPRFNLLESWVSPSYLQQVREGENVKGRGNVPRMDTNQGMEGRELIFRKVVRT